VRELRHREYENEVKEELYEPDTIALLCFWIPQQAGGRHITISPQTRLNTLRRALPTPMKELGCISGTTGDQQCTVEAGD
jgi:hypothetical protein